VDKARATLLLQAVTVVLLAVIAYQQADPPRPPHPYSNYDVDFARLNYRLDSIQEQLSEICAGVWKDDNHPGCNPGDPAP
jgi:hypothetical protein